MDDKEKHRTSHRLVWEERLMGFMSPPADGTNAFMVEVTWNELMTHAVGAFVVLSKSPL
jgi:hypothetical protein